ncbi:N-acetyltransferase Eco1/Protein [Gracilaria domingensis]|nr:N-acetyltransferase Eco1/Protein [Gracilaria domingensis]
MPIVYSRKRLRAQDPHLDPASPNKSATHVEPSHSHARPRAQQKPRKRRRLQQLYIDAGQSSLSHTLCRHCNLLYAPGTSDETLHRAHHSKPSDTFPWPLRNATVLSETPVRDGVFVAIRSEDCDDTSLARRLRRLDSFVCSQLANMNASLGGMSVDDRLRLSLRRDDQHVWMVVIYVVDGLTRAVAHAERVQVASTASVCEDGITEILKSNENRVCRRKMCGIRKIWVHQNFRHKGVASALVDLARTHLLYAGIVEKHHVAFTPPTTAGALFGKQYSSRADDHILVYQLAENGRPFDQLPALPSSSSCSEPKFFSPSRSTTNLTR